MYDLVVCCRCLGTLSNVKVVVAVLAAFGTSRLSAYMIAEAVRIFLERSLALALILWKGPSCSFLIATIWLRFRCIQCWHARDKTNSSGS